MESLSSTNDPFRKTKKGVVYFNPPFNRSIVVVLATAKTGMTSFHFTAIEGEHVSDRELIALWHHRTRNQSKHGRQITEPLFEEELKKRGYVLKQKQTKAGFEPAWFKQSVPSNQ